MKEQWVVEVVEIDTGNVVHTINCESKFLAEKVERGVLRNLNTDKYFVRAVAKTLPDAE